MSELACGIVGLPNVGKSTLFNALTKKEIPTENYPFCTIDPNVGIVLVPDKRLSLLADIHKSLNRLYAPVSFVDIAGLVKGASKGEGLGNKFLSNIRETEAIVHVVRCFQDENITHVAGKIDPIEDIQTIDLELILSDLQMTENIISKLEKQSKGKKELIPTIELLKKVQAHLNQSLPLRQMHFTSEEEEMLFPYPFITKKKVLYAANVAEKDLPSMENEFTLAVRKYAEKEKSLVVPFCAKLEQEIAQLEQAEAKEFLESVGLQESGLDRIIKAGYELLDLITFFTAGEKETKAWTIKKGMNAQQAAGKIHTDIAKGFAKAEVIAYKDLIHHGGKQGAKEAGKIRYEGKDYIVHDGDVILFHFS